MDKQIKTLDDPSKCICICILLRFEVHLHLKPFFYQYEQHVLFLQINIPLFYMQVFFIAFFFFQHCVFLALPLVLKSYDGTIHDLQYMSFITCFLHSSICLGDSLSLSILTYCCTNSFLVKYHHT